MEKKFYGIIFGMILIFLMISIVYADGAYIPHPKYWIRPGYQKAVIFHEDNLETMILTSSFIGNSKDFVWIIPTPSKPEVSKADEEVFNNAAKLTQVQYNRGLNYAQTMSAIKDESVNWGVNIIESKKVDYYDVNVLVATNSKDLVKWFNDNDYVYPDAYSYVLNSYIERGWYFTAIKVSPESVGAMEVIQDLREGHPTPVKMEFLSEKIVFPLKISSVDFPKTEKYGPAEDEEVGTERKDKFGNIWIKAGENSWKTTAYSYKNQVYNDYQVDNFPDGVNYNDNYYYKYNNYIPIELYVIADSKYEGENFYVNYANWVKKSDIEGLGDDEKGKAFIKPKNNKYFITKLSASMQKSQMDDDLYLKKSINNKKVNTGPEVWELVLIGAIYGLIVFMIWFIVPVWGLLFIIGILLLFFTRDGIGKIFGWIAVIVSGVLTIIPGLILFVSALAYGSIGNYIVISLLITWLLILAVIVIFTLLAVRYSKRKSDIKVTQRRG